MPLLGQTDLNDKSHPLRKETRVLSQHIYLPVMLSPKSLQIRFGDEVLDQAFSGLLNDIFQLGDPSTVCMVWKFCRLISKGVGGWECANYQAEQSSQTIKERKKPLISYQYL